MFGDRFFGPRFFGPRYFGPGVSEDVGGDKLVTIGKLTVIDVIT